MEPPLFLTLGRHSLAEEGGGDIPLPPIVGDHRHGLLVVARQHALNRSLSWRAEGDPIADRTRSTPSPKQACSCAHCPGNFSSAEVQTRVQVLPQFACCWSCLGGMEDASTKEFEAGSAVHRPLQHLDPTDLSFDGTGGPGQVEGSLYGIDVLAQLGGKARERRGARGGQHIRASRCFVVAEGGTAAVRPRPPQRAGGPRPAPARRTLGRPRPACRPHPSAGGSRAGPTAIATAVLFPPQTSGPRRAQPCAGVRPRL